MSATETKGKGTDHGRGTMTMRSISRASVAHDRPMGSAARRRPPGPKGILIEVLPAGWTGLAVIQATVWACRPGFTSHSLRCQGCRVEVRA
jgi:hypothetical protein